MSSAISFDLDPMAASELGARWQADQIEQVCAGRREIARIEAQEIRLLAGLLLEAEGSAGEDCIDAGDPAEVTRLHDLKVRSIATELAASVTCSVQAIEQRLGEAWTLANELLRTLAALEAGEISRAHAHEIVAETAHLTADRYEAEGALLPWAKTLPVSTFRRKAKHVLETLESESLRKRHERAFSKRRLNFTTARDGMARLDAYLDAVDAARLKAGLANAAQEAREAGDRRTRSQLEVDLAVELLLDGQITIGTVGQPEIDGIAGAPHGRTTDAAAPAIAAVTTPVPQGAPAPRTAPVRERARVTVDVLIPASTLAGRDDEPALIPGFGAIDPARARELVALAPSLPHPHRPDQRRDPRLRPHELPGAGRTQTRRAAT